MRLDVTPGFFVNHARLLSLRADAHAADWPDGLSSGIFREKRRLVHFCRTVSANAVPVLKKALDVQICVCSAWKHEMLLHES